MDEPAKLKKEDFYSGFSGGKSTEVLLVIVFISLPYFAKPLFLSIIKWHPKNSLGIFTRDFIFHVIPMTIAITVLEKFIYEICIAYIILIIVMLFKVVSKSMDKMSWNCIKSCLKTVTLNNESRNPIMTYFRYKTTVISCVCILAVDFYSFPRRFAKCETFGTSLMDTGVGFFVSCNAFVCPHARGTQKTQSSSNLSMTIKTLISTWPLLLLGCMRAISLKSVDYQEHVSEYGVHWNFFFTLAVVKVLSSTILMLMSVLQATVFSVMMIMTYQLLLTRKYYDLTEILLNDNRHGIIMANKEGIASCIGYLAIYLPSVLIGKRILIFFKQKCNLIEWIKLILLLISTTVILYCLLYLSISHVQPVSRRLCNLSFVIWQLAMNSFLLSMLIVMQLVMTILIQMETIPFHAISDQWMKIPNDKTNFINHKCLSNAVNRNQMLYFLLSNLTTGVINMTVNTMNVSIFNSVVILLVYSCTTLGLIWLLHVKNITVKWW